MKKTTEYPETPRAQYCSQPEVPERKFDESVNPMRASIIITNSAAWVNGTVLKYYFFRNENPIFRGAPAQQEVVRNAFRIWKNVGVGIGFQEVSNIEEAHIRIAFQRGDGAWSYVGRVVLEIPMSEPTMNFGWDLTLPGEIDTAIHEIGHTLGMQHEHQNPNAGIEWNEEAVYQDLAGPPNRWPRDKTFRNIIKKLSPNEVSGSTWDPNSVMHYPFKAGLILNPTEFRTQPLIPAGGLSAKDQEWAKKFYPPLSSIEIKTLKVRKPLDINAPSGGQQDFVFKPRFSRKYNIKLSGTLDAVMVLFEEVSGGERHYLSGDDDSGTPNNASIKMNLIKGRKYVVRVRVLFREDQVGKIEIS
jgi:Astacin (Peptidase family M12A)